MKTTGTFTKQSMPVSAVLSIMITLVLMLLGCAIIAAMIQSGNMRLEKTKIIVKVILAAAVFVGIKTNTALQKQKRHLASGIYLAAVVLLIIVAGASMGIELNNILFNMLFVLCGAGVGMLLGNNKNKKHNQFKKRYR